MNWKRPLFLTHRWIGIGMCLLFALWFASGIVMMYVDYPELTYVESVAAHPDLQRDRVELTPFEAARTCAFPIRPKGRLFSSANDST